MTAVAIVMLVGTAAAQKGTLTDSRDGKKYKTVKIGRQTWMAENLNYQTESGSWCYDNDDSKCKQYGRLYDWTTALNEACPSGWKLPEKTDWDALLTFLKANDFVADKLRKYGFSDQLGGSLDDGRFERIDYGQGFWWMATTHDRNENRAYCLLVGACCEWDYEYLSGAKSGTGYSVRCIQK